MAIGCRVTRCCIGWHRALCRTVVLHGNLSKYKHELIPAGPIQCADSDKCVAYLAPFHNGIRHPLPCCAQRSSRYGRRYADRLAGAHDAEHLGKFEELLEAAIDLDRIPDEYLIAASYDPQLQARHYWGCLTWQIRALGLHVLGMCRWHCKQVMRSDGANDSALFLMVCFVKTSSLKYNVSS